MSLPMNGRSCFRAMMHKGAFPRANRSARKCTLVHHRAETLRAEKIGALSDPCNRDTIGANYLGTQRLRLKSLKLRGKYPSYRCAMAALTSRSSNLRLLCACVVRTNPVIYKE